MRGKRRNLLMVPSVVVAAAVLPVASAQADVCSKLASVKAPGHAVAWRAGIEGRTAVFARLPRKRLGRAQRVAPRDAPWLLVLARPRAADGRCWVRVRLPWRPNDAAGWVDARKVLLERTRWRIDVSRRRRTLTLYRAGARVRTIRVVVGKASTPTPTGLFAVAWAIRWHPDDFLGSWVLELTAHSDVLQRFEGGDGTVGIHGRGGASLRDPLGTAASHGCVRLANRSIDWLVRRIGAGRLPGTPVRIR